MSAELGKRCQLYTVHRLKEYKVWTVVESPSWLSWRAEKDIISPRSDWRRLVCHCVLCNRLVNWTAQTHTLSRRKEASKRASHRHGYFWRCFLFRPIWLQIGHVTSRHITSRSSNTIKTKLRPPNRTAPNRTVHDDRATEGIKRLGVTEWVSKL